MITVKAFEEEKELAESLLKKNELLRKNDDDELWQSDVNSIKLHNVEYDMLLEEYVKNSKFSFETKREHKRIMFYFSIGVMTVMILLIIKVFLEMPDTTNKATIYGTVITAVRLFYRYLFQSQR